MRPPAGAGRAHPDGTRADVVRGRGGGVHARSLTCAAKKSSSPTRTLGARGGFALTLSLSCREENARLRQPKVRSESGENTRLDVASCGGGAVAQWRGRGDVLLRSLDGGVASSAADLTDDGTALSYARRVPLRVLRRARPLTRCQRISHIIRPPRRKTNAPRGRARISHGGRRRRRRLRPGRGGRRVSTRRRRYILLWRRRNKKNVFFFFFCSTFGSASACLLPRLRTLAFTSDENDCKIGHYITIYLTIPRRYIRTRVHVIQGSPWRPT